MRSIIGSRVAVLAVILVAVPGLAAAQNSGAGTRSITVVGQGEAAGPPDRATINAGEQTLAPTVVESSRETQALIDKVNRLRQAWEPYFIRSTEGRATVETRLN